MCGYLPDPVGHRRTAFRHLALRLGVAILPASVSLLRFAPDVLDQNQTGSCTGGSTGAAIATSLASAGTPLGFVPSPRGIYNIGRAIDRAASTDGSLPPLTDDGAQPNQVMRGISEWGVRPMRGPTSTGANYDCEPSNVNLEPTLGELEEEATCLLIGQYEVTSTGRQRVRDLQAALAGGRALTFAIAGGTNDFQSYLGGVMGALNGELDHYVWMYGYETQVDGSVIFLCSNQWGKDWGEAGRFRINEACVAQIGNIVVLDVKVAPHA
jgi:hypothetical protein